MQAASKNEYSEMEILDTPNFLKSFDETANLDAWDDAAAQAAANGQQRLANAQQGVALQNTVFNLSPKLAKAYKDQMDKRDVSLTAENKEIQRRAFAAGTHINLKEYADYQENEAHLDGATGYFDQKAQELHDKGETELARQIRGLTGRKLRMMHRVLLMETANSYEADFWETKDEISIPREGEDDLTWANAEGTAEKRMIQSKWREEKGLRINDIYKFSDEFLMDTYYPKIDQVDNQILAESNKNAIQIEEAEHLANTKTEFIQAARLNTDALGKSVLSFVKQNNGRHNGAAITYARDVLVDLIEAGDITTAEFHSVYRHIFPHRGTGKSEDVSVWKDFNPENPLLQSVLEKAENEAIILRNNERRAEGLKFVEEINTFAKNQNQPITEQGFKDALKEWDRRFPGVPASSELIALGNNTIEDKDNLDIVAAMQNKLDLGQPIDGSDGQPVLYESLKGDPDLYEKWQKITQGDLGKGLSPTKSKQMTGLIDSWAQDVLNLSLGVSDTKTEEYINMTINAKALYAKAYRDADFRTAEEKHEYARDLVKEAIYTNDGRALQQFKGVTLDYQYAKNKIKALNSIGNNEKIISTGIIPGTEEAFKQLEKWAANPTVGSIPVIYKELASQITGGKIIKGKGAYTDWHLANDQYKAITGKELPMKPRPIEIFESYSPLGQYFLNNKPSNQGTKRAAIVEKGNNNFNIEGAIIPGLQMEPVLT